VLDLQYKPEDERPMAVVKSGRPLNVTRGGILFKPQAPVPNHGQIELAIDWPLQLNGDCYLKLMVCGRVVRSDRMGTAIAILRHECRSSKRPPGSAAND
jgi:hypothetical protein